MKNLNQLLFSLLLIGMFSFTEKTIPVVGPEFEIIENQTKEVFQVIVPDNSTYDFMEVISSNSMIIHQNKISQAKKISFSLKGAPGFYFVKLSSEEGSFYLKKLIKK